MRVILPLAAGLLALVPLGAAAQEAAPEGDILVVARLSGAPIWEVSKDGRTLILVGTIRGLPKELEWSPTPLRAAVRKADRILYPIEAKPTVGDIFRVIFKGGKIVNLPKGQTSADYLAPALQARLERVFADDKDKGWRTRSPIVLGFKLLSERAGYRGTGPDFADIVEDEARKARIPGKSVGTIRGKEMLDSLFAQPPGTHVPCVAVAIDAAEAGKPVFTARAERWRNRDVPAVLANPLDRALGQCWPWGDPQVGPKLKTSWTGAIRAALGQPGTTLAVAPLRLVAEPGGVLDRLEREGYEIEGPAWR